MFFRILMIAVPFIWFGLMGGVSFLEAPLKFQAPGITLRLGLGIGHLVFGVLNKIEIVLGLLLLTSVIVVKPTGSFVKVGLAVILTLLLLETVWLLPALDVRAQQVIDGVTPPYSIMHIVYIAFDAIKFLLLFGLGVSLTKQNLRFG